MKNIHSRVYIVLVCIKLKQAHPASGPPAWKVSLAASTMQEQSMTYVQPKLLQIAYKQNPRNICMKYKPMHAFLHVYAAKYACDGLELQSVRFMNYIFIHTYKYKYVYINIFKFIHDIVISCLRSLKATVNK